MMGTQHAPAGQTFLLAQSGMFNLDLCLASAALFGVLGLGFWAIMTVKRWREEDVLDPPASGTLDHFQQMVDDGLLDAEEFAQIQARLDATDADREEASAPPAAPSPPTESHPKA